MADVRNRLRPQLHCGIPFKVLRAIDEIVQRNDPALYDWALEPVVIKPRARYEHQRKHFEDLVWPTHPSLEEDMLLRLIAHASSPHGTDLRRQLTKLYIEPAHPMSPSSLVDVAPLARLPDVQTVRIHAVEAASLYEWRADAAKKARPVLNTQALAGATGLERLTIVGAAALDLAPLAKLTRLRHLELFGCHVDDLDPLAGTQLQTLIVAAAPPLARIAALPATLTHVHLEDLPALESAEALASLPALATLHLAGVPLQSPPPVPATTNVTFTPVRVPRTSFDL
jgi:hypothetical protein